jgi:hypothetical protein
MHGIPVRSGTKSGTKEVTFFNLRHCLYCQLHFVGAPDGTETCSIIVKAGAANSMISSRLSRWLRTEAAARAAAADRFAPVTRE